MKKLTILLTLLISLILTGCTNNVDAPYSIYDAKAELAMSEEIEDIILPDEYKGFELSWQASKTEYLDGYQVIQGAQDINVLFTVTISDGEDSTSRNFHIKVLRDEDLYNEYVASVIELIDAEAQNVLSFDYQVSSDLYLPTTSGYMSVTWTSSNEDIVTSEGIVTQPEFGSGSKIVVLTATLSKQGIEKEYEIYLTVLPKEDNSVMYNIYKENIEQYQFPYSEVFNDLILPTTFGNYDVVWQSQNSTYITDNGVITRPTNEIGNQEVTLVATFLYLSFDDTRTFTFTILAEDNQDELDQALLDSITDEFLFNYSIVTNDLFLPTSYDVSSILWMSSNTDYLSHDGVITKPTYEEGNQDITLTATFTYNNAVVEKEFIVTVTSESATYTEYYLGVEGLTGETLKTFLHNLIDDHTTYSYASLWDALSETDEDPNNSNNVILLYTGRSQSKEDHGGGADDWNREHVWAKSHGDFGNLVGPGTDMHHIRPTDSSINSTRSNLDFDNGGDPVYDGGILTDNLRDSDSWEPRDEVKGDVARMIFYMAVRYEGDDGWPDLEINDQVENSGPWMGRLSVLIEWHLQDPPDDFERNRNDVIFSFQGNRNPFIDYPDLVELIWGD